MKIGIIGAGRIGGTLTRRLAALGHEVAVANSRGPETLKDLAAETGATAATIPEKNVPNLSPAIFERRKSGAPIVDTGNYYPQRDGRIEAIENGTAESRWVAQQIGQPVIKAFNNIYFQRLLELGRPRGSKERIALPVAGDDPAAKRVVMDLIDQLGFDAVDAGKLDDSWRQQPGTPCYTKDLDAKHLEQALVEAGSKRPEEWRAGAMKARRPAAG